MDSETKSLNNQSYATQKRPQEEPDGNVKKKMRRSRKTNKLKQKRERGLQERERRLQERERGLQERERRLQERERCLLPTAVPETSGCSVSLEDWRLEEASGKAKTPGHVGLPDLVEEEPDMPQDAGPSVLLSPPHDQSMPPPGQMMPEPGQFTPPPDQSTPPPDQSTQPLDQSTPPPDQSTQPLDQSTPPPDQSTPPPGQSTPPPDQTTPAPDQSTPPPGQSTPPPGQSTPPPDQSTPPPGQSTPPLDQSTPPPGQSTPPLDQTTPAPDQSTPPPDQFTPPPGQSTPPPGQTTPSHGQSMPPPVQSTPSPGQTTSPGQCTLSPGQTTPPTGQCTPSPGQSMPQPCQTMPSPGQTPPPPGQSSPPTPQSDVSHGSTTADLREKRPSCQTHSAGQGPTNQCAESLMSTDPSPNPGTEVEKREETARPTPNPSTTEGSGGESTPGPGRAESAKDAGIGTGDQGSRKDMANSQQSAAEERKEGTMGRQTVETAEPQGLKSAQPDPPERVCGVQKEQESGTNTNMGNTQKDQQCDEAVPRSSASAGSPVDTPSPENQGASADQSDDDEGFQTVPSKRKKKKGQTCPPQIPQNLQQAPVADGVTIYFHAILSKDFRLDPNTDLVFMVPGLPLGNWNWNNGTRMEVTRDLGQNGYLVQGQLRTSRMIVAVPIPYKYAVYKASTAGYDPHFEYIYKMDATGFVNRCLCVMGPLLTQQGEWHQYDDIICAEPERGVMTRMMRSFFGMKERDIASGRHLAGQVMLETIFDLLRSWSAVNVTNFFIQLHQFCTVYCRPVVFEDRPKVWESLEFGHVQVKRLLKEFLKENIIPLPEKDRDGKERFLRDPLKAGLITMLVWLKYLELDSTEQLSYMCDLLCLPQKPREEFSVYWRDLTSGFQDPQSGLMEVVKGLEKFCTLALKKELVKWILVLPLLHLLRGDCRPFEPLPASPPPTSSGSKTWAGLREISLSDLQPNSQHTRALMKVMAAHTHLVEVDRLLSRSWLYLLGVEAVEEFCSSVPVDLHEVLRRLSIRLPVEFSLKHEAVQQLLVYLSKSVKEQKFRCYDGGYGKICLTVSVELLERICRAATEQRFHKLPTACVELVSAVAEFAGYFPSKHSVENEAKVNCSESEELRGTLQMIRDWMRKTFDKKLLRTATLSTTFISRFEIEAWDNILSLTFGGEFTECWRTALLNDFEGKLKQECSMEQIEIYCNQIEEVNRKFPTLTACLEKCALEAVTTVCQNRDERVLFERLRCHDFRKFGKLVSALVLKAWPTDASGAYLEGEEAVLEHLLTWSATKNVFQLQDRKLTDQLTDIARERMAVATTAFTTVSNKFLSGNIEMRNLKRILENQDAFLELLKIDGLSVTERCRKSEAMKRLMKYREDEVKSIYHERALLSNLLQVCQKLQEHMTVDVEELESKLRVKLEEKTLDEFMEVHQSDTVPSEKVGVVTCFDLPRGMREMAKAMLMFRDSVIFNMCWESQAKTLSRSDDITGEMGEAPMMRASLYVIHNMVYQPCHRRYREIHDNLRSGGLTLQEVDEIFEIYKGEYDQLTEDLQIMSRIEPSEHNRWIHRRVQQIEQYHQLHLALESAKVILEVKQILCPEGDFRVLDALLGVTGADFKRETLDRIDHDLIKVKKEIAMTEEQSLCLQELCLRRNFVMWVKEGLQDLNELKVFVDLASISAGENDLDVDRVACFHHAVLGYSSVLYELKPNAGFRAFKKVLGKLWKTLKNDSNLPKKLRDTARHLEWLKTVKNSHGSVELSSLSLASAINTRGLYILRAQNQQKLSLDTALKLEIMEEHREEAQLQEVRSYSMEDLRELLNKLMLMSGRGEQGQKKEADRFSEVFSSVQRMGLAFIDLHAAGNPLFQHWEAKISCHLQSEASIVMDFHLGSGVSASRVALEGDVLEQLPDLCRKMERYLTIWKGFMNEQRSTHYYLNYYTAEQVVYLCDRLSPGTQAPALDGQVVTMLSFIRPECDAWGLREMLRAFWGDLHCGGSLTEQQDEVDFQTFADEEEEEDAEEGEEEEPWSMEVTLEPAFREGGSVLSTDALQGPLGQASGSGQLELLWDAYMRDMRGFLPHTLDVPSLGRLLRQLAEEDEEWREGEAKVVRRSLPGGFFSSRPNLVVCPPAEILTCCLCVYMASELEPLPSYDEVLLCEPDTPYQQVELFLRRCLTAGYRGQKIYILLHADRLAYDVSYRAEQLFQALSLRCTHDYRLVIICSSTREHAYLPSAFSQYRLLSVPQEPLERVQRYLSRHYTVPADRPSAADVFRGRQYVGVVSSKRAGVGKSLYVQRLYEKLQESADEEVSLLKCIRLIEPRVDENVILKSLLNTPDGKDLTIFHFDVMSSVQKGLHEFLFRLLILRYLMDSEGRMWKCSGGQLYLIEILQSTQDLRQNIPRADAYAHFSFLDVFPTVICCPPKEVLGQEMMGRDGAMMEDPLMDDQEFRSEAYQRPYQYLTRFHKGENLDRFVYRGVEGTHVECLQILFIYCGVVDPSWAELRNFSWFLNVQLRDCETSIFCDVDFVGDTLQGFRNFVVDFMILMAKDFATPSLSISDQSPGRMQVDLSGVNEEDLAPFRIRKRWEAEPHPYIFFNGDHISMTFIGFHLRKNGQNGVDAIHPTSGAVIRRNIMTERLYEGLRLQRVPFNVDFDGLSRDEKIHQLCNVLGVRQPLDPDKTYELTTDNILKMLAIHMRFRCDIPVVVMGETGCGKTRLVRFLCQLRRAGAETQNMTLVKVHGGTTSEMIYSKVREAAAKAATNKRKHNLDSVLFFDEANTTEAVSSIKEVLCDWAVDGERLAVGTGLQIIAACNPYRKHSDEMIQRLESAGLGYRVRAEETEEKLGSIPLRQLVYRVQVLPPSMIPLVWDFGQLNDQTEKIYIQQIVQRVVQANSIDSKYSGMMANALSSSQRYMRSRKDECGFVSLRDVERCIQVFVWFQQNHTQLLSELSKYWQKLNQEKKKQMSLTVSSNEDERRDPVVWSLVMAIGVCYHACLENKEGYRKEICKSLPEGYTPQRMLREITLAQDLLLSGVPLGRTIARNTALKENVFMMVVCIELRIPLFLVGKPGSSKSLSKTLVADAMQGHAAHSELFRRLKQVHLVSFQCSPHSTPEGIINTFKQCTRFQEGKNLEEYVSVVVLDEIGLAEDSPKMPLKTLHPLLEEGCIDDEPLPHKKVGFIGISNWALDPAKMNRGVFVSRGDPDEKELIESAKGICSSDRMVLEKVQDVFRPFAKAYLRTTEGKGFFGLRDYYSLIKMVFGFSKASKQRPSPEQIVEAVLRNFSGRDDVDVVSIFTNSMDMSPKLESTISTIELVRKNILAVGSDNECRYLLVLTKNYAALQILQQMFFSDQHQPEIIFGSSFPKDQEYTQICRNINRVKICMETGQTVILLNLQNLYESLYDALNQYYVCLGGQNYVDLGLGTHRVKCRVHPKFRLIVIEEKEVVYREFPVPLINRLEKHYLDINAVLRSDQKDTVKVLEWWVEQFIAPKNLYSIGAQRQKYRPPDVFIGYHSDTCSSVVLQVSEKLKQEMETPDPWRKVLEEAKLILLNCATPDSVVRLLDTALPSMEAESLTQVYFQEQQHSSLAEFILSHTHMEGWRHSRITEVTTFSRLLTASDVVQLRDVVEIPSTELLSLQQFDTEQSFLKKIRNFLDSTPDIKMLIIQTDFDEGSQSACILASAKYSAINEINKAGEVTGKVFVYFITKLPRMEGGTSYVGFHGGNWSSVHIDDLRRSKDIVSDIKALRSISISQLFQEEMDPAEVMEVDEAVPEQDEGLSEVLDTTALVRSCVQSAVSMLRDEEEGGARCTRRVEILLTLLAENEEMSAVFLKTVKRRLHSLLVAQDSHALLSKNWVLKEASNVNALQEGGTFKHTLWKRVQVAVTPLLARLVSVLDRDHNLDLLLDCNSGESVKKLWLDMFGDESLLDIPYTRPNHSTDSENVLVQSHIRAGQGTGCAMPFSWRIREHLEEVWTQVHQRDDHTQQKFEVIFGKTPLGQLIAHTDRETQKELFQRYLQDFVSMTIKWTSEDELQLLSHALASGINELSAHRPVTEPPSLPWVHIAYQRFRTRLHNLHRMLTLLPHLAPPLLSTTPTGEKGEMVLDVFAALACVEHLEPQMLQSDDQRLAWLRQVKSLQVPLQLVCALEIPEHWGQRSRAVIGRARNGWNRIFVLSLFVEHLLLGVESVEEKLKALMLGHTLKLGNVLEKSSDLQLEASFLAVIEVLKSCKDAASGCIFEYGLGPCLVCLMDPQEPLVLPCGHVFCLGCGRHRLVPGQMYCPKCVCPVPDDFPLNVSEDVSGLVKFRKRCHSFFIELVSSACFRGNRPPSKGVIHHLLSFLMVEAEPVPLIRDQRQILTKALTPFHESVDRNPVVRSVVLKLLLKYSFSEVREYLEQHLSSVVQSIIVDEGDKCNLYALYINCLEDSMFERLQRHTAAERRTFLQVERDFLRYFLSCDPKSVQTVTVELLQQVARVRLCLDTAAQLLTHSLLGTPAEAEADPGVQCFLDSVRNLCTHGRNDWYRVYLIRLLCSRQGVEFVQNLLKEGTLPWLFPQEILTQKNEGGGRMDQYLVCGDGYKAIREAVAKATAGCRTEGIATVGDTAGLQGSGGSPAERTLYLLLALFREVTTLYRAANPVLHPTRELCKALEVFMKNSRVLVSREIRTFAVALVRNRLGPLCVQADRTGIEHTLTELAVHLSAVLLCGNDGVLKPLRQLALSPSKMQKSFIPTMPEDIQYMAVKALGAVETQPLKWYTCQNDHLCAIGECGRPLQKSRCLDCGAEIGGEQHAPVTGFTETQTQTFEDRTQPGHILGDPSRRDNPEALDTRNVSPVPFAILRMLTHLAMLLGVSAEPQSLGVIIIPPVLDPGVFLMQHLQKDLEQLTQTLGLGVDDTVSTVHLLLRSLLEPHLPSPGHAPYDDLATKEARHGWETAVINDVITPQLKNLEQRLKEVNVSIRLDSRVTSNPVMKVVFGDPSLFLTSLPRDSLVHRGAVWSCRERVSLPNLAHVLGQKGGKDAFPLLWTFLQKEAELRLVKFLPDIVALQRDLVKGFQNRADPTHGTIGEFIQNQRETARETWEKRIRGFLSVWNQLRFSLATNGEIKIPAEFCQEDLDLSSDLQVLLPRRQGVGLCSTALVSYLIALHNQLVYATDKHTGEETSYRVSVTDLTELHVIGYEPERDLIPLILSNCQYSLERGQETLSQYDLPKIQQLILSRILQGKPFIDLSGIPALFTRQDRDYERIFTEVKGKVGQEPLPTLKAASLGGALQAYSDVCETLGVVEVALDFLAAAGGDANMELVPYLEDVLRMEQVAPHILKALSRCHLKHCVALWQFLSSLKSESMLHLKRDPFMGIGDQYRKPLGEEVRRQLTGFCSRSSVEAFLQEMHQFLLLHLNTNRDPDLYLPDWGLKETLQSYMERKDLDLPSEVEEIFPEEIRLSQALTAWRFTVAFKQGRSLR